MSKDKEFCHHRYVSTEVNLAIFFYILLQPTNVLVLVHFIMARSPMTDLQVMGSTL